MGPQSPQDCEDVDQQYEKPGKRKKSGWFAVKLSTAIYNVRLYENAGHYLLFIG